MVVNCNYDCFNCLYPDCINDALPTSKEAEYMQIGHMKYTGTKKNDASKRYNKTLKGKLTHQKAQKKYYRKCSKKILEARRLYYQEHKEEELKKAREYKEKNKEALAEKRKKNRAHENELARINYEKNKEKINARKRAWYEKNKERINEKNRLKRAKERRAKECNVHVVIS